MRLCMILACVAACSGALAQNPWKFQQSRPLQALAADSEAIVAVTVLSVEEPKEMAIGLPGDKARPKLRCHKAEVDVYQVILPGGKLQRDAQPTTAASGPASSTQPATNPVLAKPVRITVHEPVVEHVGMGAGAGASLDQDAEAASQFNRRHFGPMPRMRKGQSYALYLARADEPKDAYIIIHGFNAPPEKDANFSMLAKESDPANWPWGKSVEGLQLAVMTSSTWATMPGGRAILGEPQVLVALRNTGKTDLQINAAPADPLLKVTLQYSDKKTPLVADLDKGEEEARAFDKERDVVTLAPGRVLFISAGGAEARYLPLSFRNLETGKATLTATYDPPKRSSVKYWTGSVTATAPVEVMEIPVAPPGPPAGHGPVPPPKLQRVPPPALPPARDGNPAIDGGPRRR